MYFALRGALTHHKPMSAIADVLRADALYPHPERLVTFLGNHDTKRFLSEPGANPAALHLAFGLLATLRGMPQLYYGDEIAMTGGDDPDNRRDFPGGFSGDKADAFTASGRSASEEAMHAWVQELMQLRAKTPALESGQLQVLEADEDSLAFVRAQDVSGGCDTTAAGERYLIVVNDGVTAKDITVPTSANTMSECSHYSPLLHDGAVATVVSGKVMVHLPGQEMEIFRAQR
jgi:glycosidase